MNLTGSREETHMLTSVVHACLMVVFTVVIHSLGFSVLIRVLVRSNALSLRGFQSVTGLVIVLACWLILIHISEIGLWAFFYYWCGCLPDAETALYFSGVTYTTVGFGEIVLPKPWRLFAPLEALAGILMCGLSTGLFFALVSRWISTWIKVKDSAQTEIDRLSSLHPQA